MILQKATRQKVKLRLNLSGPAGSGKTMSALKMAYGITGDWTKIGVIDSENGSASLYAHLGPFNVINLEPPFTPERYTQAIDALVAGGMELGIIDSSSHEWSGAGGCLESNDMLAQSKFKGNTWAAWNETTPRHDRFVNKVLQCPIHIITCTRSKMETVQEGGKVKKIGMKDIQRENWEYDLTVSLSIDRDTHMATASKDRTNVFEGTNPFIITSETGKLIKQWCESGVEAIPSVDPIAAAIAEIYLCPTLTALQAHWMRYKQYQTNPLFIAAKDARKAQLTPTDDALLNTPADPLIVK